MTKKTQDTRHATASRPTLGQQLVLQTPNAQRVYRRKFDEVANNFYSVTVSARFVMDDDEASDQIEEMLKEKLGALKAEMEAEVARLNQLRSDNGIDIRPSYTDPMTIECDLSSPMAFQFAKTVQMLDEIVVLVDSLWLTGEFTTKQKKQAEYRWQKAVFRFAGQLREISNRARKATRLKQNGGEPNSLAVFSEPSESSDSEQGANHASAGSDAAPEAVAATA